MINVLIFRYMDLAAYADEKLVLLTKAIPLSERFHEGIEAVMEWVEAVEDDLRAIDTVDLDTQQQVGRWSSDYEKFQGTKLESKSREQ